IPYGLLGLGVLLLLEGGDGLWGARLVLGILAVLALAFRVLQPAALAAALLVLAADGVRSAVPSFRAAAAQDGTRGAARALARAGAGTLARGARQLGFLLPSLLAAAVWLLRSPARDAQIRNGGAAEQLVLNLPNRVELPAQLRDDVLSLAGQSDEW